jgi:hypothetical protein
MRGRLFIVAYRASGRNHPHLLPSLLSMKPRAMAGYGDDDGTANNGFGRRSLHQWEGRLLYMAAAATTRRSTAIWACRTLCF